MCAKDAYANATGMPTCLDCPANTDTVGRGSTNVSECSCKVRAMRFDIQGSVTGP